MIDADIRRKYIDAEALRKRVQLRYAIAKKYDFENKGNKDLDWMLRVIDEMAQEQEEPQIIPQITGCDVYDRCEEYKNCTVQVLTNSTTGEVSVGWWQDTAEEIRL